MYKLIKHFNLSNWSYSLKLSIERLRANLTCSMVLQFLSHPEEVEVSERILTANLCKSGAPPPLNLHHDATVKSNIINQWNNMLDFCHCKHWASQIYHRKHWLRKTFESLTAWFPCHYPSFTAFLIPFPFSHQLKGENALGSAHLSRGECRHHVRLLTTIFWHPRSTQWRCRLTACAAVHLFVALLLPAATHRSTRGHQTHNPAPSDLQPGGSDWRQEKPSTSIGEAYRTRDRNLPCVKLARARN